MSNRSWRLVPKTTVGMWTVGLIPVMLILFAIGSSFASSIYESVPAGGTLLKDIIARPALALTMLAGMAAGVSAFIVGLLAILKHKENALLVYVSALIGGLLTIFLVGEFAFPH
jgi:hypothetical protein